MISLPSEQQTEKFYSLVFSLFIFFLPLFSGFSRVNNLFHIAFTLLIILLICSHSLRARILQPALLKTGLYCSAAFLFYFSLTALWSDTTDSFTSTLRHGLYLIAFIILIATQDQKRLMLLLFGSILTLCILTFWYVDKSRIFTGRLNHGFFAAPDNVIDLGGYFGIGIFCGLILIRELKWKWLYLPTGVLFLALLLTQSRGPLLSLCIACVPLIIHLRKVHLSHILLGLSVLGLIAVTVILTNYDDLLTQRIIASYEQSFIRFGIWVHTLELVQQHPVWGWGFDKQLAFVNSIHQPITTTHSIYFAALLKGGIVGFLLLGAVILSGLYGAVKHYQHRQNIEASLWLYSLLFHLTQGMFIISNPNVSWIMFWLPYALMISWKKKEPSRSVAG